MNGTEGMPRICPADDCAWAWWNATIDSTANAWGAAIPLPVFAARFPANPEDFVENAAWWPWQTNLTSTGGGASAGHRSDAAFVNIQGWGPFATARSHRFSADVDELLDAKWSFPEDLEIPETPYLWGNFRNVTFSYEVRTLQCARTATFWTGEWTGDLNWKNAAPFHGSDETTCG